MRDVLPIKMLATEISENVGLSQEPITHFRATVWEDNAGSLISQHWNLGELLLGYNGMGSSTIGLDQSSIQTALMLSK
jgi:hypothetical protein